MGNRKYHLHIDVDNMDLVPLSYHDPSSIIFPVGNPGSGAEPRIMFREGQNKNKKIKQNFKVQ